MFVFISGESGSGKSLYAERRLESFPGKNKFYIAAAEVHDSEMAERVKRHKSRREGKGFITIERSHDLGGLRIPADSCVLIEALTTWLANEMFIYGGNDLYGDFQRVKTQCANIILVSDYLFSDGVIYDALTENYIRTLAELTRKFAAEADEVIECFAGLIYNYKLVQKNE